MALSFKDEELDRKVRRLARLKNMSFTGAVRVAVDNELAREEQHALPRLTREEFWHRLRAIQEAVRRSGPVDYSLSENEILGYDENGIPTR